MELRFIKDSTDKWSVMNSDQKVAILYMDPWLQISQVVLCPGSSPQDELNVLRCAASHVMRYCVRRQYTNGILKATHTGTVSETLSATILQDFVVPEEVAEMDIHTLKEALRHTNVEVVSAAVLTVEEAIETALSDPRLQAFPVEYMVGRQWYATRLQYVAFSVGQPAQFRIWHSVGEPGSAFDLYIVPSYHPDMTNKTSVGLINGSTDALIRGKAIKSVSAPPASCDDYRGGLWSGSWNYVTHPYYSAGSMIMIQVSPTEALSNEGIAEIRTILLAMLEQEDTYLSVSGGFRGPYDLPQNIASRTGLRISTWDRKPRGSEGFCVWAHQVLSEENELDGAYVPAWFQSEGWVSAYERVRVEGTRL